LLEDKADIAVHSMKDVPFACVDGLEIAAICEREDPRDVLVTRNGLLLKDISQGAILGTSSLRRQMQILNLRPDLNSKGLRGNVPTRLQKCLDGDFDIIILAAAGLQRLGLAEHITESLSVEDCLPAVGQGAVGVEVRSQDGALKQLISQLNHEPTSVCVTAERAMNATLQGSCSVPLAGYASLEGKQIHMSARIGWPDGSKILKSSSQADFNAPIELGQAIAQDLLNQGAEEIMDACR
jgi:hydroxymethylbilane synthase